MQGSKNESEAPESTSACTDIGGRLGTKMCTRRARWQGWGYGREWGRGKLPPSQTPTGWGSRFLAGLGKIGCEGRGQVSRALDRTPEREGGDLEAGAGSPLESAGSWE